MKKKTKYKVYLVVNRSNDTVQMKLALSDKSGKLEIHTRDLLDRDIETVMIYNKHFNKYLDKKEIIEKEINKYTNILNKYPNGDITIEIPLF